MISSIRPHGLSRLLAGTALVTMAAFPQLSFAETLRGPAPMVLAQAQPAQPAETAPADKKTTPQQRQEQRQQERANRPQPQAPAAAQHPPAAPAPSTAQHPQTTTPPTAQERREDRRDQRRQVQQPQAPAAQPQAPATAQQPQTAPAPSTAQQPQPNTRPTAQERREQRRQMQQPQAPAAQPQAPATAQQPQTAPAPSTAQQPQPNTRPTAQERRDQRRQGQQPQTPTAQQPAPQAPTAQQPAQQAPGQAPAAVVQGNPAAIAPPTQPRDAREFMRRDAAGPVRRIDDIRKDRQEVREGNRTLIREGDRTIIRENNTTIIRHSETNRFVINAANVRTERRGGNIETIVQRGGGYSIVNVTDVDGRLIRRVRRDGRGRDIVIIDNSFVGVRPVNMFVMLPPPVIRIPRERYIVEMGRARPDDIYGVFMAPPVEPIAERYTLDQVRFSAPLRDRMPRVDLDVTFDTGSWQLAPEQVDKLSVIAEGINKALQRNPREVFMVEGYTDATGADEDNLSLSDRRAESVAVALTEQFKVPPENLVTQGYGEQYLKVDTQGPEEANRRVAVRRITPLIDGQQATNATR